MKSLLKVFWVPVVAASLAFSLPWDRLGDRMGAGPGESVFSHAYHSVVEALRPIKPASPMKTVANSEVSPPTHAQAPRPIAIGISQAYAEPAPAVPPPATATGTEPGVDANVFASLAHRSVPSVVNIFTRTMPKRANVRGHGMRGGLMTPWGMIFPGGQQQAQAEPRMSLGTGFVIASDGIILTNNHVIDGADEVKVQFTEDPGEKPTDAKVIGRDPELDVALLQVKTDKMLPALRFGDSDALAVGDYVMAVGNPFGQGHSVTHGIVSAKGRLNPGSVIGSYLQTDAMINPGNSGGPLVNLKGEVIGVNAAIDPRAQGIGFAIPINLVKKVLPELRSKGVVARGYIGVGVEDLRPEIAQKVGAPDGLRAPIATQISGGSPAALAGLKPYDVIVQVGDRSVHTSAELVEAVTSVAPGSKLDLTLLRQGKKQTLELKVGERKVAAARAAGPQELPDMDPFGEPYAEQD